MISKYSHKDLTWINLSSPNKEEISHILEEYFIPIEIKDKIINNTSNDDIILDYDYIFVSLSFSQPVNKNNKIIFVVKDNFILTIHNEKIQALDSFSKDIELDIIKGDKSKIDNSKLLFSYILKNLYLDSQQQITNNNLIINNLHNQIIKKHQTNKKLKILISILLIIIVILTICL